MNRLPSTISSHINLPPFFNGLEKPGTPLNYQPKGFYKRFGEIQTLRKLVHQHVEQMKAVQETWINAVRSLPKPDYRDNNNVLLGNLSTAVYHYGKEFDTSINEAKGYLIYINNFIKANPFTKYYFYFDSGDKQVIFY